jgi:hypothetical protein
MKKWLCFLLAFGLMAPQAWAADDDEEWEDEEEEAPKKKAAPPKKASKSSGTSRMGLAVSFSGEQGAISFVYDLGSGLELGLGLGLHREHFAERAAGTAGNPVPGEPWTPDPEQRLTIVPSIAYSLGTGLLDYGIGVNAALIMEPGEGGNSMNAFPYFYAKAELVKNLSLKLSAGMNIYKPSGDIGSQHNMVFDLMAQGAVIFYFL